MDDGGAELRLDVVADDRQPLVAEALLPRGIAGDEHRHAVDHRDARFERAFHVEARRLFGADRQVVQQHLGARRAQRGDDFVVVGFGRVGANERLVRRVVLMCSAMPSSTRPMRTVTPLVGSVAVEHGGAIGQREDRFGEVASDLARVDVERGNELDIGRAIIADSPVHQADCVLRRLVRVDSGRPAPANSRSCRRRRWQP